MNWQKGFNRFWLLMTAVVAVGGFIATTVNPHNESFPESLQEISVFVTGLFNLVMGVFVSVLFFVLGHGVHVVILWVLSGFIKQMSFQPMKYNPFNKNDLWCESAALREKDNNAMANKIYWGFRLILLGVGSLVIIGCTKTDQSVSPELPENEWIGRWARDTFEGLPLAEWVKEVEQDEGVSITITANSWTFSSDGSMEIEFAFEGGSLQGSFKWTGTYSLSGSNYTITITESKTTGVFSVEEGNAESATGVFTTTGTWYRQGNTLTINFGDDGDPIILRKK